VKALDIRILEHIHALEASVLPPDHSLVFWSSLPVGVIKLSVYAALAPSKASIAVVARNSEVFIIKAWAKEFNPIDSLLAEASAIVWALNLLFPKDFIKVM
jgi:hypothetical protein